LILEIGDCPIFPIERLGALCYGCLIHLAYIRTELIATANLISKVPQMFRTKLFNRIVLIFSAVTIVTFCTLAVLVYDYLTSSMIQQELNLQTEAVDNAARYLDQKIDQSQDIVLQLYQNKTLSDDLLQFLRYDIQLYIQNRVNDYLTNGTVGSDSGTFFRREMRSDVDMLSIALYSRQQSILYVYGKESTQRYIELGDRNGDIAREVDRLQQLGTAGYASTELARLLGDRTSGAYTFAFALNDPDTLENAGVLLVTYDPAGIQRAFDNNRHELMGTHLTLFPDGKVVYDSTGQYRGKTYPYFRELTSMESPVKLGVNTHVVTARTAKSNLVVSGLVPVSELQRSFVGFETKVVAITGVCILITVVFSYVAVYQYARRTRAIVKAMKQARQGNLSVRIPVGRDDELDDISTSFNLMCEELMHYINQVYVSEIKQKHAELVAFQAQINPHFLYNTLEAIRMRALTQGASDVGEMAYVLGSMFRYAVKPETVVTLEEEIEYCRQFLELYRLRYQNKIDYDIDMAPELNSIPLLKLALQPLIENAIVHGIRPKGAILRISIRAFAAEDGASFIVEAADNGKGMDVEKLTAVRKMLAGDDKTPGGKSIGLRNVHERIHLTYGKAYGLTVNSEPGEGTVIRLSLPYSAGRENSNV
jgi:two-component system sensor histidine kinase YesM